MIYSQSYEYTLHSLIDVGGYLVMPPQYISRGILVANVTRAEERFPVERKSSLVNRTRALFRCFAGIRNRIRSSDGVVYSSWSTNNGMEYSTCTGTTLIVRTGLFLK